jgi:hypothetical protein
MEWAQTSCLMALIVNILRDPRKGNPPARRLQPLFPAEKAGSEK